MALPKQSTYWSEQERRSLDSIRVYNPTNEDYVVKWDLSSGGKLFRVKAKQEATLPRYIAVKYIKEMVEGLTTAKADNAVKEENKRREEKGMAKMTKWEDQEPFERPFLTRNKDTDTELIKLLYRGVEREYGIDTEVAPEPPEKHDGKSSFEKALESVEKEVDLGVKPKEAIVENIEEPKDEALKCDQCDFSTKHEKALNMHKGKHKKAKEKMEQAVKKISK